jgi:nicotinamidase-related amidase
MATSALIVIDMLDPYVHDDADELAANVEDIVDPLRLLIDRARESDAELVYVNDNYGDFSASRDQLIDRALGGRYPELGDAALRTMQRNMRAEIVRAAERLDDVSVD